MSLEKLSLTKQEIAEKIDMVREDLMKLRANGAEEKKLLILAQYIEYLEDEFKVAAE